MEKIGSLIRKFSENEIRKNLKEVDSFFIIGYSGISSSQISTLRQSLRRSKANLFVIKNSISRRVFEENNFTEISKMLQGPCGLVFVKDDPIATSKVLANFAKEFVNLKIEGGFLKDRVLGRSDIITLASLPDKKMLYTKVATALQSPISNFVSVLNNTLRKFVWVLNQIKDKKQN